VLFFSVHLVAPVIKHVVGRTLRLRSNFQGGTRNEVYEGLKQFGFHMDHVDAVFSGEQYHQSQVQHWINTTTFSTIHK
jgi:hypothetical protein